MVIRIFLRELRRFNYTGCDLLLDALEDYLKGPEFIMSPTGEEIMARQSARAGKLKDLRQNFSEFDVDCNEIYIHGKELKGIRKFWYEKTYNGHLLPTFMLNKKPGIIAYDWFDAPEKQYLREAVLAVNPHEETGILRYRSRREFLRLMRRYRLLNRQYKKNENRVKKEYENIKQKILGAEFWKEYLK